MRRHGHPEQLGVTKARLAPYLKRVQNRVEKNASSKAWNLLAERWAALHQHAKSRLMAYRDGQPMSGYEVSGATALLNVAVNVEAAEVVKTALAMFLMQEEAPHRFKSDTAFNFELVRRIRGLATANGRGYFDQRTGKVKTVYRESPPRETQYLAGLLRDTFGDAGLYIGRLERKEADTKLAERAAMRAALEGLE